MGESGGEWDNVPFQFVFRGATKVTLDAKGRMVIPTRYRERLQERGDARLVVTIDRDQCLLIYPLPEWEEIEAKLMRLPTLNEHARRLQRLMVGYATDVELDSTCWLSIPALGRDGSRRVLLGSRTVWRRGGELGLVFAGTFEPPDPDGTKISRTKTIFLD